MQLSQVLGGDRTPWICPWCQVQPSQKKRAIGAANCKKEGMLLQTLSWRCVESAIHRERDVREDQHTNICGANKQ